MGREISVSFPIQSIISLVPSQTELFFYLGLKDLLLGRTKFCIHPKEVKEIPIIGGTKNLRLRKIREFNPDLIIGNREENDKSQIEELSKDFSVWLSDIKTFEDSLEMILNISALLGRYDKGLELVGSLNRDFRALSDFKGKKVLYLIWAKPYMGVGNSTFINDILIKLNLKNVLGDLSRYPELSEDQIIKLNPDFVFLSSEPFPFKKKHLNYFEDLLPKSQIFQVNGEMFSWYGPRLLHAKKYFESLHKSIYG